MFYLFFSTNIELCDGVYHSITQQLLDAVNQNFYTKLASIIWENGNTKSVLTRRGVVEVVGTGSLLLNDLAVLSVTGLLSRLLGRLVHRIVWGCHLSHQCLLVSVSNFKLGPNWTFIEREFTLLISAFINFDFLNNVESV